MRIARYHIEVYTSVNGAITDAQAVAALVNLQPLRDEIPALIKSKLPDETRDVIHVCITPEPLSFLDCGGQS